MRATTMAQLHTHYLSSPTTTLIIPPNVSSSFVSVSFSSRNPSSLSLHHRASHAIRCTSQSSILAVETPSSESQPLVVENEVSENSDTRLLAQNVPWSSTVADIRALFQQFGSVLDVELSMHNKTRNRGLAFVEMGSAEEAAEALSKLEGFEYEGRTLRLTYAKPRRTKASPPVKPKPPVLYNLFVANLPFEARAKDVKEFFQAGGSDPFSAEVIFHDNPRKSSGYGFVSFKTKKEADEALTGFEGKELLGRPIRVARSRRFVKLESEMNSLSEEEQDLSTDSSQASDQPEAYEM
ncbi:hypothetical protein RND81_01G176500 [Saponaria officinalis]|uniref:RRM domain-containing protein n=1 Tax=Saponaria officinalis TaxID=3572 RepID=A0AAW1NAL8_SAPOF